jgi:ATP-dependent protease HslVU (ClpYQ) peptidase subunit
MPINFEELIIKITANSAQAISELNSIDKSVQKVGQNAASSAKKLAGVGLALGGARGAVDIAVKAIGSYIKRVEESKAAFIESITESNNYYNAAADAIIELDKLREQAQINEGKRRAERNQWFTEARTEAIKEREWNKENAALLALIYQEWDKQVIIAQAAGKSFMSLAKFQEQYLQKLMAGTSDATDLWMDFEKGKADAYTRGDLVKKDIDQDQKDRDDAALERERALLEQWKQRTSFIISSAQVERDAIVQSNEFRMAAQDAELAGIEALKAAQEELRAQNIQAAQEFLSAWSATISAISSLVSTRYQNEIDAAEDGSDKQKELMKKQFNAEKAMAITMGLINTAAGIIKAIPNPFLMAFAAASGALQIAAIAAQKPPSFATGTGAGGYVVPPGYSDDSYPVMARSGERVTVEPAGGSGGNQTVILQLDGRILGKAVTNLFDRRQALVPAGAVVA